MEDAGETLKSQSSPSLNNSTPAGVGGRLAVLRAVPTPRSLLFPAAPQRWSAGPGRCCARICAALQGACMSVRRSIRDHSSQVRMPYANRAVKPYQVTRKPDKVCDAAKCQPANGRRQRAVYLWGTRSVHGMLLRCHTPQVKWPQYPARPHVSRPLALQRRFKEGCPEIHERRRGAWHGSALPVRYLPAYPRATAAAHPNRSWGSVSRTTRQTCGLVVRGIPPKPGTGSAEKLHSAGIEPGGDASPPRCGCLPSPPGSPG